MSIALVRNGSHTQVTGLKSSQKPRCGLRSTVVPLVNAREPRDLVRATAAAVDGRTGSPGSKQRSNAVSSNTAELIGRPSTTESETTPHSATKQHKQFDWFKAWYPLAVLSDLDPQLPSHAKLLGMDMAVWYDKNEGKWRVFQDRCPHRLAPLSEGRLDAAGSLYCNYHGWQFDGSGACKGVPQLQQGQAINPKKACAVSYPTCEREGLLWVWADASPAAAVASATPEAWPGLAPELDSHGDKAFPTPHKWYFRDLPATYLAVKENAFNDCSHDTVLHHGSGPMSDREKAAPIAMKVVNMTPTGYVVRESTSGRLQDTTRFPCGARRDFPGMAGIAYVVPTGVGSVRQFHTFITADKALLEQQQPQLFPLQQKQQQEQGTDSGNSTGVAPSSSSSGTPTQGSSSSSGTPAQGSSSSSSGTPAQGSSSSTPAQPPKLPLMLKLFLLCQKLRPTWLHHMQGHLLVDADLAMQSRIDIHRCESDHVYMPAAADAGPAAFLRWLREYGGGGPPVSQLHQPFMGQQHTLPSSRQQLLDRFNTHTAHCKPCRTAYTRCKLGRQLAAVVGLLAGAAAVAAAALLAAVGLPADVAAASRVVKAVTGLGVLGVLSGVAWGVLGRVLQGFVFVDYGKHHPSKA